MNKPTKDEVVARKDVRQLSEAAANTCELGQLDIFGQAQAEPNVDSKSQAKAQEDLDAALGELGDIFGKNFRMNMMPEQ